MRKRKIGLTGIFIDPFLDYLAPRMEEALPFEQEEPAEKASSFDSEKLCLLIFIAALVFVAAISPILCFGSLLFKFSLEGMWYFWLVTIVDTGCFIWRLARGKGKEKTNLSKPLANQANCNILKLYDISDTTIKRTEFGGMHFAKES